MPTESVPPDGPELPPPSTVPLPPVGGVKPKTVSRPLFLALVAAIGLVGVLSVAALGVGAVAIASANEAKELAARPAPASAPQSQSQPPPTADPGPEPSDLPPPPEQTGTPNDLPSVDPGELEPSANFRLHYGDQKLRVQASCGENRNIDLDEPRVAPDTGADFTYYGCSPGSLELRFGSGLRVSQLAATKATANECAEAIRSAAGNNEMAPAQNLTLCILTEKGAATDQGIPQKIVLLRIDSMAKDGTLNISVTAWNVPT